MSDQDSPTDLGETSSAPPDLEDTLSDLPAVISEKDDEKRDAVSDSDSESNADDDSDDLMDGSALKEMMSGAQKAGSATSKRRRSSAMTGGAVPLDRGTPDCVVRSIFRMFDDENSGKISISDFQEVLEEFGVADVATQIALTKLTEAKGDGEMTFDEFKRWVKEDQAFLIIKDKKKLDLLDITAKLFDEYDPEHSSAVSWEDWKTHFEKTGESAYDAKELWSVYNPEGLERITFRMFWSVMIAE
jgi:hypothetical protein